MFQCPVLFVQGMMLQDMWGASHAENNKDKSVRMEAFRQTYLRLCKEGAVEPQESVMVKLQECRASRLDLSGLSLSTDTCTVLGRAFQNDTFFSDVSLSDCMLSEEGAKVFLTGIFYNTTLKVLDLKGNNLKSTGAEVLGKLLARNKALIRLVLDWNALGVWDEAFTAFCEGLSSNCALTHLDLRNNQINHHGTLELAQALKRNSTLKVLEQIVGRNTDRQSTLRESHSRTQVLSKEIQILKQEKGQQFQNLMVTIDRQREEMGQSSRSTSIQINQLQEALNGRKSAVNSLTTKLQMMEAALALSEQKNHNLAELIAKLKVEKEQQLEVRNREKKKEHEDSMSREAKHLREIKNLTETNVQLKSTVEEVERRCKSQQQQLFELKQELTNSTAELKLKLAQAEDRLEIAKRMSKQALEDLDNRRQRELEHVNRNREENEKALQERILKLEGQRIQLEEDLSRTKAACVAERSLAEEQLGKVRAQVRQEEQAHVSSLEEKLRSVRSSLQEVQLQCSQQKQIISEQQAKNCQQTIETDGLRRRIEELQQELSGKDQEKVAEVSRVRVELQEQIGHLEAERTAQGGLKEKICALEREIKVLTSNHREALLDKESETSSLMEKLRLKEVEIQRMRDDEAQRASCLQNAILTYVKGSPLGQYSSPKT
ncbi:leucine-rich repeat-containing protein 45 isoform X3 [Dunckerocampus dactyliophorus]|uniref:leucine-rich repeat-containing protein 45 isoform X3 n=1 Tax=Dunckerocampus dactyliophorus TaxID=161453 RepID=UPI002405B86B|nr:leucine-rich repeat-containing protein 45 isoform X3 [Dunckerocampus dactyliophorus]